VHHVSKDENTLANVLAQQVSGFRSNIGKFIFLKKMNVPVCQIGQSSFWLIHSATVCSAKPSSAKPNVSVSESRGSEFPGSRMKQVKRQRPILMIGGHP
jgi:hypothetical protein